MDPIVFTINAETATAFESVKALHEQALNLGEGYSAAVDRAERKIFELTRSQQVLTSAISESRQRVEDYQRQRQSASEAEQSGLDASIKKEQQIAAAHEKNISLLESKITLLKAQKDAAEAASNGERVGIQLVAQERITELQLIRDTTAAIVAGDKAAEAAAIKAQAALDAQAAQQAQLLASMQSSISEVVQAQERHTKAIDGSKQRIADLQSQATTTNEIQKARIDAAIAKEQSLVQQHSNEIAKLEEKRVVLQADMEAQKASSDAERASIQQVAQARLADLDAIHDKAAATSAGDKAQQAAADKALEAIDEETAKRARLNAQYDELTQKQRIHLAVIDADKDKIDELTKKKSASHASEQNQIDEEIAALRKVITTREQEILLIEAKKVKLQEALDLHLAGSDAERQAAEAAATQRLTEIGIARDQAQAQNAVNDAVDQGVDVGAKFFNQMVGLGTVIVIAKQLSDAFKAGAEQLEREVKAAQELRDINAHVAGSIEPAYQAFNVTDEAGEKKINQVVLETMQKTGVQQEKVVEVASAYGQFLNHSKIDPSSDQGKGLIATGALYARQGVNADATGYVLSQQLQANPNLTGDQLNQKLADYRSNFDSNKQFNTVLDVIRENGDKFQAGGIDTDETIQLAKTMAGRANPAAYERLMRQMSQSLTRNAGKTGEELLSDFEGFGDYTEGAREQLKTAKFLPLEQQLQLASKLVTPGTGAPQLLPLYQDAIKNKKALNLGAVLQTAESLPANERDIVNRKIAGPRDVEAGYFFDGYTQTPLTSGTPLQPVSSGNRTQQTEKDIADLQTSIGNAADPGGSAFNEATANAAKIYDAHINDVPDRLKGAHGMIGQAASAIATGGPGYATQSERDAAYAYGLQFMQMIRLREQAKTPEQKQRVQNVIEQILDRLEVNVDKNDPDDVKAFAQFEALAHGTGADIMGKQFTGAGVLAGITDDAGFVASQLPTDFIGTQGRLIADPKVGGEIFRQAQEAQRAVLGGASGTKGAPADSWSETPDHKIATWTTGGKTTRFTWSDQYHDWDNGQGINAKGEKLGQSASQAAPQAAPVRQGSTPVSVNNNYNQRINNYGTAFDSIGGPASYDQRFS